MPQRSPACVASVIRTIHDVVEYRATVRASGALGTLSVEIEIGAADRETVTRLVASRLHDAVGLKVPVIVVEPGTLPRFDMKARRFVVNKDDNSR